MEPLYSLPDLPYAYDALEPWCDATTLELHHSKHHQAYVDGANKAAGAMRETDPSDAHTLTALRGALTFNLAGHTLHSLFWENLSPEPTKPSADLGKELTEQFGSPERLTKLWTSAAMGVQGSGWGALAYDPVADQIYAVSLHDHQHHVVPNSCLIAVIDVWEHAYYLTHRNDRATWVGEAIEHVDWARVATRLRAARA